MITGSAAVLLEVPGCLSGLEEFATLPDLTMPFLEGIQLVVVESWSKV